eukprot:199794_1
MRCFCSKGDNDDDDDELKVDLLNTPKENKIKIALLGPSDSGKSTIIKQLGKMHNVYIAPDEKLMSDYIKESLISNMKILCHHSKIIESNNHKASVHKSRRCLRDELLSLKESHPLNSEIVYKIDQLWHDDGIQFTLQQRHTFHDQMDDNTHYFFNKIEEIADPGYVPNFEDNVHLHRRSIGHSPIRFMKYLDGFGEFVFDMIDVSGSRTERKKWWNETLLHDPELSALIYMVPISDYNLTLFEDNETNRLIESIRLFKEIMGRLFFTNMSLFLLFNKYDVYLENIKTIPITHCFDDVPNGIDPNHADQVLKFIAGKFLDVFTENKVDLEEFPLRILRTTAIDEANVEEVFDKIMPQIVSHAQNITDFSFNDGISVDISAQSTCTTSNTYEIQRGSQAIDNEELSQRTNTEDLERYREINEKVLSALRSKMCNHKCHVKRELVYNPSTSVLNIQ